MSRAGWYRDPDDPTRFRHWDGRGWTTRHRSWPSWDLHAVDLEAEVDVAPGSVDGGPVVEGPVRATPLPAAAARGAFGDDAAVAWLHRPQASSTRLGGGGRRPGQLASTSSAWTPSRAPLVVFCLLVAAAVAIMAVSVGLGGPRASTVDAVATDMTFVRAAGVACQQGLGPLRRAESMSAAPATSSDLAAAATADASAVTATGGHLRQLPVRADAAGAVRGWLDTWGTYVADQRALAASLGSAPAAAQAGSHGAASPTGPGAGSTGTAGASSGAASTPAGTSTGTSSTAAIAGRVAGDVISADQFALANGLAACRLGTDPSAGAVDVP